MKISFGKQHKNTHTLVLPFLEGKEPLFAKTFLAKTVQHALSLGDFSGKKEQILVLYPSDAERVVLLGLGEKKKLSTEVVRRCYAALIRAAMKHKWQRLSVVFPEKTSLDAEELFRAFYEGMALVHYTFEDHRTKKTYTPLEEIQILGIEPLKSLPKYQAIVDGICYVRDLVNGNADTVTPAYLVKEALAIEKSSSKIKATIFDREKLTKEKMGLILAVGRGSPLDPYLIQLAYRGDPSSKEHIVLVGKGVTYDTGGLSLKPSDSMLDMKCDMAGAATVLGVLKVAAELKMKVNVTAVVPTVENAIGSKSYKLGDVYHSYSGKSVEIDNTDAEGRLILADALSYTCQKLKPTCIIDLATLTGAILIALGSEIAGFFCKDESLTKHLLKASQKRDEPLWHLPLREEYFSAFDSDIADLKNTGGREAGSMKAALFLEQFVDPKIPWAHMDIAGTAFWDKPRYYHASNATGYGVRMLIDFLEQREEAR